ncbi:uncharacterized protein LOC124147912 [Haliotis rufescens]|uniref:uncharacterized protein LOC124147912 n=1 Tax=Haliotis rufescens TaxID=6454 RepID=UPI00201EFE81|nr:uncharacterized protein LOC124147912 [Haliotis rufescens]XP_046374717.2 uncharacterized protein LOC124147912 [Haliotis rufescens]XP_046374719.2 uncharacterized protein LOC124147912 [Haliotis rufescens]
MESTQLDDFDAEVWSCFRDNDVKEFTSSPPETGLIRPIPVRLEPPFPWDCGIEFDAIHTFETAPKRFSAFIPVSKTADRAVGNPGSFEKAQPTLQPLIVKDTHPSLQRSIYCKSDPVEAEVSDLLQRLTTTQAELDSVRDDLTDARLNAQCLELMNKHLTTKLQLMETEKENLKENVDDLKKESEWLKLELKRTQDARRHCGKPDEHVDVKRFQQAPAASDKKYPMDGKSALSNDLASAKDSVEPKTKKKKFVLKQLRKAFRKITR